MMSSGPLFNPRGERLFCLSDLKLKGSKATKAAATRLGKKQMSHPDTPAPLKKQPKVDI
jgi:hypothetical protein